MRVFLAGTTVSAPKKGVISKLFQRGNKLHSFYHCVEKGFEHGWWKLNMKNKVHLFLDSGAFSAWNQGVEVDLDAYIEFCLEHLDHLAVIANLDVIPGRPFQKLTQADIDHSSRQGWTNYQKMLAAGIPKEKLVHIFHQGEDLKWLKRIAGSMPYIGLSPANDKTTSQKITFLDSCMPYVTDSKGMPTVKFHGFAVTSLKLMLRYPWYSVDSTSWVMTGRLGGVYVPRYRAGKWIYDEDSWKVQVSTRSPSKKDAGKHIDNFPPKIRQVIIDYFNDKGYILGHSSFFWKDEVYELKENERWCGKALDDGRRQVERRDEIGLSNEYRLRDELNITYFLDLEKEMPEWPCPYKVKGTKGFDL